MSCAARKVPREIARVADLPIASNSAGFAPLPMRPLYIPALGSLCVDWTVGAGADQRADIVRPRHAREPVIENAGRDAFSDVERRIEDMTLRRIDEAHREILLSDLLGDRLRRNDEHVLRHSRGFGGKYRHPHGREDGDVVALARDEMPAFDLNR